MRTSAGGTWSELSAYQKECDAAYDDLKIISGDPEFSSDIPTVVCVARNEESRLPHFLDHYAGLGVRRFHIIDNGSTDATQSIGAAWSGATVWYTESSYARASFGQLWVGAVARRHGLGKWVLNVDCDEFLVYPGMEKHDLGQLCKWIYGQGQRRLFAPQLDMYPQFLKDAELEALVGEIEGTRGLKAMLASASHFDRRLSGTVDNYNFDGVNAGVDVRGGVRHRISLAENAKPHFCLTKYPLSLWDGSTAYANAHFPWPFKLNPTKNFAMLLHFKIMSDFPERVEAAIAENQHWSDSCEYRAYRRWMEAGASFYGPDVSEKYAGMDQLERQGLISPIGWGEEAESG